jgi:predicted nucleic acid-binding protein
LKVLFDTNIILDILLNRAKFVDLSANLVSMAENKEIQGYLCATTITTIDYLVSKKHDRNRANIEIQKLLNIHNISQVNRQVLDLAINSEFKDFEDAVQYYSGKCVGVDCLVTRNPKDYKGTQLAVYSPSELLSVITLQK